MTNTIASLRVALAGRYVVEEEIGHGGSGSVYRARDTRLDRLVALKVLSGASENQAALLHHFGREAKILASINSPNIAAIHGYEESNDLHLLVLEYVDGLTLRERLQRGPLPLGETLALLGSVASALKSAHDLGIIHCDLKPENVKITRERVVKILDFGIARRTGGPSSRRSSPGILAASVDASHRSYSVRLDSSISEAGIPTPVEMSSVSGLAGTPPYMSPEQATKEAIDNRTDIWGFGCLLFECLAGKSPFARPTVPETLLAIVGEEPDWTLLPGATPQRLRDLIRGCLEKDPGRRVRDILDAELELKASVLEESPNLPGVKTEPPRHNLPVQRTRLVGRTRESEHTATILGATRLVTLVGPGGTGKTRLAIELALKLLDEFVEGVWLVGLGKGVDADSLPATIARVLSMPAKSEDDLVESLRSKRMLLLLDGCEQELSVCTNLVSRLLSDCPLLSIVATGTGGLGVAGEAMYQVLPLSLPEPTMLPSMEELRRVGAVELFADRLGSALPSFTLNEQTAPTVVEICRRTSGLPLAVELAAARATTEALDHVMHGLSEEIDPPVPRRPTARELDRAMRSMIEWACRQLSPEEHTVLRRLAVFAGGWTMEAANAVCTAGGIDDVLDPHSRLVDASLVFVEVRGGQMRYRMPNAVREYAHDLLTDSSDCTMVHRRHCDFFLALAERTKPSLAELEESVSAARFEADAANHLAALQWAEDEGASGVWTELETAQEEILLRRLSVFEDGWTVAAAEEVCGDSDVEQVEDLLMQLADRSLVVRTERDGEVRFEMPVRLRRHARQRLLESGEARRIEGLHRTYFLRLAESGFEGWASADQAGWLRRLEADYANLCTAATSSLHEAEAGMGLRFTAALSRFWEMRGHAEEGLHLTLRALGDPAAAADPVVTARARFGAARLALRQGDLATAQVHLDEASRLFEEADHQSGIAATLDAQAIVAARRGNCGSSRALCEKSLRLYRKLGDERGVAWSLLTLGEAMYRQGEFNTSRELREKSRALFRNLGDKHGLAWALTSVGKVAFRQGDHVVASGCYTEGLAIHRELGDKAGIAWSLSSLAHVAFARGELHAARALLEEALVLSKQVRNDNGLAWSLCHLGTLAYHEGDNRVSTSLLLESLSVFRRLGAGVGSAWCLTVMGSVARRTGKLRRAHTLLSRGLSIFAEFGEKRGIAGALRAFSLLAAASGQPEEAVRLLSVAKALQSEMGETLAAPELAEIDTLLAELRHALGEVAFAGVQREGRALSSEEAILLALGRVPYTAKVTQCVKVGTADSGVTTAPAIRQHVAKPGATTEWLRGSSSQPAS